MIPFMGETVCRAFNFVLIPVFLLLLYNFLNKFVNNSHVETVPWLIMCKH